MALLTHKMILQTFDEMLYEMPFDKITVSSLVKRCGISSNTFYYHYQDIYALLDEWLAVCVERIKKSVSPEGDWKAETKAIILASKNNARMIEHILKSLSREQMERYVFTQTGDSFIKYVRMRTEGKSLSEEQTAEIAMFCRYAFVGMFLKANWEHFQFDTEESVDRIGILFEAFVDNASDRMLTEKNKNSAGTVSG